MTEQEYCCEKFKILVEYCDTPKDKRDIHKGINVSSQGEVIGVFWCDENEYDISRDGDPIPLPDNFRSCPYCGKSLTSSTVTY